jgi:hypothetical protein
MRVANVLYEGKPMGMLYEKNADGEHYKTATLVVGNSMGPASVLGRGSVPALKSGAVGAAVDEREGRQRVYFERNRHGKWRPVLVPKGELLSQQVSSCVSSCGAQHIWGRLL